MASVNISAIFRSLRSRNFKLYFAGQSISLIGTWMQRLAVSWLVYDITHSAFLLGLVMFAGQIPALIFSPYGGALTDRHSRYKILLIAQVASMIQAGLLAFMILGGFYSTTGVLLLSILLGCINAFDIPSRQSLMIELIDDKNDLPNAIALNSSMVNLARLIGPVVAGLLISWVGEGMCFLINTISFIPVIGSLLLINIKPKLIEKTTSSVWEGLKEGYHYLRTKPDLTLMILLMTCVSFSLMPIITLLPIFAKDIFKGNAATLSYLEGAIGLGALGGAIFLAGAKKLKNLPKTIIFSIFIFAGSLLFFSFIPWLGLSLIFLLFAGIGQMIQISGSNSFIQTHVDDKMRGRVISYYAMAFQGMMPIGSFIAGFSANHIGVQNTVIIQSGLGLITGTIFYFLLKKVRLKVVFNERTALRENPEFLI
ncbi:MFS transporter [Pedobacter psychrophilus]|uniref:MFS transporter n=1 Tax=Pedobacter psychrophilus TaxID=1826909 RepID=A0A179DM93_9SPHI|nr:MFS transporter [Pedobacter psychrophilus]OAQ42181.1 MFS transporter [Pedobacter psychrophilus]